MEIIKRVFFSIGIWFQNKKEMIISSTWKDTIWVLSGSIFNKILGLVSFTILTRSLGPEMYGVYSIALSVLMLAGDLSDLGINSSLIRFGAEYSSQNNDKKFRTLVSISLRSRVILGFIIFLIGMIFSKYLAKSVYHNDLLYPYLIIAFSGVFIILLNSTMSSIFTAAQQFKYLFIINICYGLVYIAGIIILFFSGNLNSMNAFIVSIIAPLVTSIVAIKMLPGKFINLSLKDKEISKKIYHFGKWMFFWSLGYIAYNQINIIMLSNLGNVAMVGYYNTAYRIAVLTQILTGAYSTVLNPKLSSMLSDRPRMLRELRQAFTYYGLLIFALCIGIIISPAIIRLLAGVKYDFSIPIMQLLFGWMILYVTVLPFSSYIYARGKTQYFAISIITSCVCMALTNFYLIPLYGAWGAALSLTISQIPANLIQIIPVIRDLRKTSILNNLSI